MVKSLAKRTAKRIAESDRKKRIVKTLLTKEMAKKRDGSSIAAIQRQWLRVGEIVQYYNLLDILIEYCVRVVLL